MIYLKLSLKRLAKLGAPEFVITWYRKCKADNGKPGDKFFRLTLDNSGQAFLRCRFPAVAKWMWNVGILPRWVAEKHTVWARSAGAFLRECEFSGCNFDGANLSDADCTKVYFEKCTFTGANFTNADLRDTFFDGCDAKGATFRLANATETVLPLLKRKQVKGAILLRARWQGEKAPKGYVLRGTTLMPKEPKNCPQRRRRRRRHMRR